MNAAFESPSWSWAIRTEGVLDGPVRKFDKEYKAEETDQENGLERLVVGQGSHGQAARSANETCKNLVAAVSDVKQEVGK